MRLGRRLAIFAALSCASLAATAGLLYWHDRPALTVRAVAHQWWWEFQYPELGITTRNALDVPADEVVRLEVTSADVVHALWIPGMREPAIAAPGGSSPIALRFRAGTSVGTCDASCGCGSRCMSFRIRARPRRRFERWAGLSHPATLAAAPSADAGPPPCAEGALD